MQYIRAANFAGADSEAHLIDRPQVRTKLERRSKFSVTQKQVIINHTIE